MTDPETEAEKRLKVIQENPDLFGPARELDDDTSALCVAAVFATEWMDGDGRQWFSWASAGLDGEALASWRVRGFLAEVEAGLNQAAFAPEADDDGEEDAA